MTHIQFNVSDELFAVVKLPLHVTPTAGRGVIWCHSRTALENSLVCAESEVPASALRVERGWRCLSIVGPLDFALVGVLADILRVLADAAISVFVISTYDTDLILVKDAHLQKALSALRAAGYERL